MKLIYQEPLTVAFKIALEGTLCLSGGLLGDPGDPGANFDPIEDIFDSGDLL